MCKFITEKNALVEGVELLLTREILAVSFDRLVSHLFSVVGREIHWESFVRPVSCTWNLRMRIFEHRISEIVCIYVCMYPSRLGIQLFPALRANLVSRAPV